MNNYYTKRKICPTCKKKWPDWKRGSGSYCSRKCYMTRSPKKIFSCKICKKSFKAYVSKRLRIYCSRKCMFLDPEWIAKQRAQIPSETNRIKAAVRMTGCFVGKLNPNYKTGFHVLRREIRERANGICELCKKGHKGLKGFLDIHHLDRNPENNSIDNTKMICPNCHRLEHIRMKNNE